MRLYLYLSPHLDDAVLSCGGLIHRQVRQGDQVLVLTVFAGDPPPGERSAFALLLGERWQAADRPVATRRAEDRQALALLGAGFCHWDYPDCIFRLHPTDGQPLYPTREAIFGLVHPWEAVQLVEELAQRLQELCARRRPAVVYSLLTAGHHVDHQLVQWAARRLAEQGWAVCHYEDYPYVEDPARLQAALAEAGGAWQPEFQPLAPADLEARIAAIACYRSQLAELFGDPGAMPGRVSAYAHSLGGGGPAERYWWPRDGAAP